MRAKRNSVYRALRGASYLYRLRKLRYSGRGRIVPEIRHEDFGFRFVIRGSK
jgi:hypothetical protein